MRLQQPVYMLVVWLVLIVPLRAQPSPQPPVDHQGIVRYGEAPVPGVVVRASQDDAERWGITNPDGAYALPGLTQGTWLIELDMPGFAPAHKLLAITSDTSTVSWQLELLPLSELNTEPAPGFVLPPQMPRASDDPMPLLNSWTDARLLTKKGETPFRPDENVVEVLLINGSVDDGASTAFGNNQRSGRPQYTGDIDVSASNSALDARPYPLTGQNLSQPAYSRAEVLLSLGGPVPFVGDGLPFTLVLGRGQNETVNLQTARVPTIEERGGDFSANPVTLLDPVTGSPFPDNVIPASRLSPQASALLDFYPLPDLASGAGYNYELPTANVSHQDNMQFQTSARIRGNRLSGSLAFQSARSDSPNLFAFVDRLKTSYVTASLNWSGRLTTNTSGFAQYVFSGRTTRTTPHFAGLQNVSGNAGIAGNSQDPRDWGPPDLGFSSGIAGLFDAQFGFDRTQSGSASYGGTWTRGRHAMSYGGGFRREHFNTLSQRNARGKFTFTGDASGIDFADFLMGIPSASEIAFGNPDKYFRQSVYDAYVMDDWRLAPQLTVNFGVRWEYESPVTERYGRLVNLDIAPDFGAVAPILASQPQGSITGERYPDSLVRPDPGFPQPRVGIAWRPLTESTLVVRAGYGIYRNTAVYPAIATEMAQQSPLSTSLAIENSPSTPLTLANGFPVQPGAASTFAVDPDFRTGHTHNWQLSIQQDGPAGLQFTASYAGVMGTRLPQRSLPNTFPEGAVSSCPECPSGYIYLTSNGSSSQHAGTISLRRRQRSGLGASVQYTWSKAIDDAGLGSPHIAQNWLDLSGERSLSTFDRRHQVLSQVFYTTGMMTGFEHPLPGWLATVLREWTLTAEWQVSSGAPSTPVIVGPVQGTGIAGNLRPDRTGAPLYTGPDRSALDQAAFALPTPGTWGNAGRNILTGPGQFSLDGSIGRTFRTSEGMVMDLRVEIMNVLNHVTVIGWNTAVNSLQFGLPSGTASMRTIRPSLRLRF